MLKYRIIKKRIGVLIFSFIFAAVCMCSAVQAYATGIIDNGDFMYRLIEDGTEAAIIKYCGESLYVSLPEKVNGHKVTTIGAASFRNNATIKELEISSSVVKIEANAFSKCTSLKKLQIPGNVDEIGKCAFSDCSSLETVKLYDGVRILGEYAFSGCTALKKIGLPNSLDEIGDYAFFDCSSLAEVSIPMALESFGAYALEGTRWLRDQKDDFITVGDGILIKYNSAEKSKTLPEGIKVIGRCAFANNKEITTILLSRSTTRIDSSAFENCTSLKKIGIPESVRKIDSKAFYGCSSLESVTLPAAAARIDQEVFAECTGLVRIEIPGNIETVGEGAFRGCTALRDVQIKNGVQLIEDFAFENCISLSRIIFPDSLKELYTAAVSKCRSLTRIEFNGNTHLYKGAVSDCQNLQEVVFYKNLTEEISERAIVNTSDVVLFSDNSNYVSRYAASEKFRSEDLRNLAAYIDKGVIEEKQEEKSVFSSGYGFIVALIILIDLALVGAFSVYILFLQPKGRHRRTGKQPYLRRTSDQRISSGKRKAAYGYSGKKTIEKNAERHEDN